MTHPTLAKIIAIRDSLEATNDVKYHFEKVTYNNVPGWFCTKYKTRFMWEKSSGERKKKLRKDRSTSKRPWSESK